MAKKIPSSEDSDLFRQTIGKVHRIKNDKVLLKPEPKPKPYPQVLAIDVETHLSNLDITDIEKLGIEDTLSFTHSGIQTNVLKKLRRGHFGIDAEIDLHGLTAQEAKHQLLNFLHNCVQDGYRCVHIIHGKGYRSQDNYPILKNNLNIWLRQHKDVQAFCSASAKDGGAGAVIVLLQLMDKYKHYLQDEE